LESYNYFSLSRILALYLTEQFGFSDMSAGTIYGLWGTLLTLYGLFLGGAIDWMGIKKSLVVCFVLNIGSRLVMGCTTTPWLLLLTLLGPNTVAGSLGVPVMTISVKRYTNEHNRGFAFSLFYTLMNVAALSQGLLLDVFRLRWRDGFNIVSLDEDHVLNNGTRLFVASGCITSIAGLVITFFLTEPVIATGIAERKVGRDKKVDDDIGSGGGDAASAAPLLGDEEVPTGLASDSVAVSAFASGSGVGETAFQPISERAAEFWRSLRIICSSRGFLKFMVMCLLSVNVKSLFRHLDATLPKYQLRAFGANVPIGVIYSINPAMIVLLVPIIGALTTGFAPFDMIHYGAWISGISPIWMVFSSKLWSTAAFVATLSLGEAIWSPRWYDYSMQVAPDGREGLFTALTSAPLFLAMLPTGMISGALLKNFCSSSEECDGRELWGIVLLIGVSSPLLIALLQHWIRPAAGDFASESAAGVNGEGSMVDLEPALDVNEADPVAVLEHVCQAAATSTAV
jgi:proton-dependent oligopeptide transporter, POT family